MKTKNYKPWKHYHTRACVLQDYEISVIRPTIFVQPRLVESGIICTPHGGKLETWHRQDQFERYFKWMFKEVQKPGWMLAAHCKELQRSERNIIRAGKLLMAATNRPGRNNMRIIDAYEKLIASSAPLSFSVWFAWALTELIEPWLFEELTKHFSNGAEMFEHLGRPTTITRIAALEEALLRFKISPKKDLATLTILAQKYGYLNGYSINDSEWTSEDLQKLVAQEQHPKEKLFRVQKERAQNRRVVRKALHQLKPFPRLYKISQVFNAYVSLRDERADILRRTYTAARPFFRWFEKKYGLPFGWSGHLSKFEIENILWGKMSVPKTELAKRVKNHYVVYFTKNKTRVISDPTAQERFLRSMIKDWGNKKTAKEIRGKVAFPGLVRGRARVIMHSSEAHNVQAGEVLVANMTHSDYLVGIKRAAAIVTDEGGIVCHAAIVSRELRKPCIVGTKNATKLLKTGDLVEVDAKRGTVRKLTK